MGLMSNLNGRTKVRKERHHKRNRMLGASLAAVIAITGALGFFSPSTSHASPAPFHAKHGMIENIKKLPRAFVSHRHSAGRHRYCKGARGKWQFAYRVIGGMKHNWWRRNRKETPFFRMEQPWTPSIVTGLMHAYQIGKEKLLRIAEMVSPKVETKRQESGFTINISLGDARVNGNAIRPVDTIPVIGLAPQLSFKPVTLDVKESRPLLQMPAPAIPIRIHDALAPTAAPAAYPHRPAANPHKADSHNVLDVERQAYQKAPADPEPNAWRKEGAKSHVMQTARKLEHSRFFSLADYRAPFHSTEAMKIHNAKAPKSEAKSVPAHLIMSRASRITVSALLSQDRYQQPLRKCAGREVHCSQDVGYIPSAAKKKAKQLKVTQGAEGIPPKT